jgi:hypothetical protein
MIRGDISCASVCRFFGNTFSPPKFKKKHTGAKTTGTNLLRWFGAFWSQSHYKQPNLPASRRRWEKNRISISIQIPYTHKEIIGGCSTLYIAKGMKKSPVVQTKPRVCQLFCSCVSICLPEVFFYAHQNLNECFYVREVERGVIWSWHEAYSPIVTSNRRRRIAVVLWTKVWCFWLSSGLNLHLALSVSM